MQVNESGVELHKLSTWYFNLKFYVKGIYTERYEIIVC